MNKYLEDARGNKSSKRLAGMILLTSGIVAKVSLMIYGAIIKTAEGFTMYDKIETSSNSLITVGAALLGVGVVELFTKFKN